jgi:hypothetical protein
MPEGLFKFLPHSAEIHRCRLAPRHNIHIHCRQQKPHLPERFPDTALDPVAGHGATDLFADRDPETRLSEIIFQPDDKKAVNGPFAGRPGKPGELFTLPQPQRLGKPAAGWQVPTSWRVVTWQQCGRTGFCGPSLFSV